MNFALARRNMVDSQMLPNRVTDKRVIDVMLDLPREIFLPNSKQGYAYIDKALSIGNGRFIIEPMVLARMLQALELKTSDVALSIGCGSGYSVAALAKIVDTVVAIEVNAELAADSTKIFSDNEINNVVVVEGNLHVGYPKQAPYDVIFFDGGVCEVPSTIKNQLGEKGRAVAIVMQPGRIGCLNLYKKFNGIVSNLELFEVNTPLLPGFESEKVFSL